MKRKLLPPFLMLFTGAVSSLIMISLHYEAKTMLIILLGVLLVFYFAGYAIKKMLDRFEAENERSLDEGEVIEKEALQEESEEAEESEESGDAPEIEEDRHDE